MMFNKNSVNQIVFSLLVICSGMLIPLNAFSSIGEKKNQNSQETKEAQDSQKSSVNQKSQESQKNPEALRSSEAGKNPDAVKNPAAEDQAKKESEKREPASDSTLASWFKSLRSSETSSDEQSPSNGGDNSTAEIATGHLNESRPWRSPQFKGQNEAIGWSENAFDIPKGMEKQVDFWIDIYSKYSTKQGLIHDSENIDLVYEVLDFSDIEADNSLSSHLKEKAKKKRIDESKKRAVALIEKLEQAKSDEGLSDQEKKVYKYFSDLKEDDKFATAKDSNRIRFQLGQADRIEKAIFISGRYLEDFERVFAENKLPIELTRLVFVESSFNVLARSKVGASGLWQIMPYTARPYRYLSSTVDRRNFPADATKLAAKLLRDNYSMLQSWPLAITGYNHGPAGVRKMTDAYKTRSLPELIQNVRSRKSFGFASRNFYACFLAALEVEKNAPRYFKNVRWSKPLEQDSIKLPRTIGYKELLRWFGGDNEMAQVFNPHLTHNVRESGRPIPVGTTLMVPSAKKSDILLALSKGQSYHDVAVSAESKGAAKVAAGKDVRYKVQKGDTLSRIASDFGLKVQDILKANELSSARKIYRGQIITIPAKD